MLRNNKYLVVNIRGFLTNGNSTSKEKSLKDLLFDFSCPKNPGVERFLKNSAIEFTKKNQSVTYLIISVLGGNLLGFYTLSMKPITVEQNRISKTTGKN